MTTIGLIGAGHIGGQLARAATAKGYDVVISNSRGPETLTALIDELGPTARAGTAQEAAEAADIAVVTIPVKAIHSVPAGALAGKTVIDTNNYYPQRDGSIPELDSEATTSAELLQRHLPGARVVKAFNHIQSDAITAEAQGPGTTDRRALAIAGDDAAAKAEVSAFIDAVGFDVVDLGALPEGWRVQPDTPGYGPRLTSIQMAAAAASASRRNG
ncbi:NADP oxidoreductase [Aeromicrobium sp. A1-2]|uniref:NADPH-dependent F420 reductase n=1 Tax=Aeromicrobium sp. A1-2 TaxID=2107713 RepID=UPI000E4F8677|nr:NADPH-dependent F420 reductase [Aeromicrobium sp. A1-2]AXT85934.1 NADP oxidoreductase [Aeromicrobium sp. A1-2]